MRKQNRRLSVCPNHSKTYILSYANHRLRNIMSGPNLAETVQEVIPKDKGIKIMRNGKEENLEHPKVDPYWILAKKLSEFP